MSEQPRPSREWTPHAVEQAINDLANQIAHGVNVCSDRYGAFLDADRKYDFEYARAYLRSAGPAHEKKYAAEVATTELRAERDIADTAYRLADRRARALQDQLRAMQSVGASIRSQYGVAGRGEGF